MNWGALRGYWRVSDTFGDELTISFVPANERPTEGSPPDGETLGQLEQLVYDGFAHSGAVDDGIAGALLEIYDALTNERMSSRLPRPTEDPEGLLRGFDREMRDTLVGALVAGEIRVERAVLPPWPFVALPEAPETAPDVAPVSEQTTFIAISLVDQDGNPVPDRRYKIALASGRTLSEGRLDSNGRARVDGLDPASCIVTFPDIDAGAAAAGAVSGGGQAPPPPPSDPGSQSWVAIQLAGDPTIYTGLAYELTTPDGNVHAGTMDGSGMVRVDGVPPGLCKLRFPDKADGDVMQASGDS